jgi:hypothetical protein
MKEAQQRRWAKIKGESQPPATAAIPEPSKPKRKLSAAGRAAIIAATKKRWRLAKAAKVQPVTAKKAAPKKVAAKRAATKSAPVKKAAKASAPPAVKAATEAGAQ